MSPETERALVEQAKGDPQAFALLYDHYVERIYTFLYRRSGDADVAQEITAVTFEKVLRLEVGKKVGSIGAEIASLHTQS